MRNMTRSNPLKAIAAIVGVGPRLGRSVARKFAREGYTVAILARDLGRLSRLADEIAREEMAQVFAIRIDCSDCRSVKEAFEGVLSLGFVEVLVYNAFQPVSLTATSFTNLPIESFEKSIAVSSTGACLCAQQVLPGMLERGRGTILFTGCSASLRGTPGFTDLCCGKFALRALAQCLSKEFQNYGVHIAHIIIDGIVGPPRGQSAILQQQQPQQRNNNNRRSSASGSTDMETLDPDAIAQTYWLLHIQDRGAWTAEMDLCSLKNA